VAPSSPAGAGGGSRAAQQVEHLLATLHEAARRLCVVVVVVVVLASGWVGHRWGPTSQRPLARPQAVQHPGNPIKVVNPGHSPSSEETEDGAPL
jgi:hypothetical protein